MTCKSGDRRQTRIAGAFASGIACVVFVAALASGQAHASAVCVLTAAMDYSGTFALNSDGTLGPMDCTSVQQQDKTWSNFSFSGFDTTATTVTFSFAVIGGQDVHTITISSPYGAGGPGATYNWSYNIDITGGPPTLVLLNSAAAMDEGRGAATLNKDLMDNNGNSYNINFTQTAPPVVIVGNTTVNFAANTKSISAADTLTIGAVGSNVSAVSNSYTESAVVPEPGTLALLGTGIFGLGIVLRRTIKS